MRTALLLGSCVLLLTQCAKQVVPTGGPKDETPPQTVRMSPENFTTNFYRRDIEISFDEFIELKDAPTQVFMSPSTHVKPTVKLRNKTIYIALPDTLQPNTTYTLYFGTAIRDINEGNVLKNFQYVFSTGSYIDSLRLQGFVYNALESKPYANASVMLRRNASDSAIVKTLPDYFTRTDEQGFYRMDYLRGDAYKLTALDDANSNFKYEPSENVGFRDSLVIIKDTSQIVIMQLFKAEPEKNKLVSARTVGSTGRITVVFAKAVENLKADLVEPVQTNLNYTYNLHRDTVTLYTPTLTVDSLLLHLHENNIDTTLRLKFAPVLARDTLKRKQAGGSGDIVTNLGRTSRDVILPYNIPLRVTFPTPLSFFDSSRIRLSTKSDTTKLLPIQSTLIVDTFFHKHVLQLGYSFKRDSVYVLHLLDSLGHDARRNYTKAKRFEFRYGTPDESGNALIHVKSMDSSRQYILILRSTPLGYERKWMLTGKDADVKANDLVPGAYTLQLVRDDNRNGRRDTGNYWEHRQPETVTNYSGGVTIRANWDAEITLQATGSEPTAGGKGLKEKK